MQENPDYLQSQLITYIGNKRSLLDFIGEGVSIVQKKLNKEKLDCLDVFAGSGIVARYLKQFSNSVTVNDLELYSTIINSCYLSDLSQKEQKELKTLYKSLTDAIQKKMEEIEASRKNGTYKAPGFISKLYAPQNAEQIQKEERCFYTPYNANYLDVARQLIDELIPEKYRNYFIAPLLSEASIHANTAGIFKGFYKNSKTGVGQFGGNGQNALSRITGKISLPYPVFSNFTCKSRVFNRNANELVIDKELYGGGNAGFEGNFANEDLATGSEGNFANSNSATAPFDLAYFDPPYNQHPYGSNYFMLNLVAAYKEPDTMQISRVSGIPKNWNRSLYNKKKQTAQVFYELVKNVKARFVLISFNSEGFISKDQMLELMSKCGKVQVLEKTYNAFKGSRNLSQREIHVKEFLFLVEKKM